MSLFNYDPEGYTLHSGKRTKYFIDCDRLSDDDIAMAAKRLSEIVPPFSSVESIPRGGDRLAEAMRRHLAAGEGGHLICDDVWSTGTSMREAREKAKAQFGGGPVYGAVIFSRAETGLPHWCHSFADIDL